MIPLHKHTNSGYVFHSLEEALSLAEVHVLACVCAVAYDHLHFLQM